MPRYSFAHLNAPPRRAAAGESGDLAPDQDRLPCRQCDGDGAAPEGQAGNCPRCAGVGSEAAKTCGSCDGDGEAPAGGACPRCDGEGLVYEDNGEAYTGDAKAAAYVGRMRAALAKVRPSATAVPVTHAKQRRAAAPPAAPKSYAAQVKAALAKTGRR